MRKVLSFVLVLALVLGSFSMAFAATPASAGLSDIADSANVDAIQVAYDLGIVTGNPDGTFLPEKSVNRAEFAAMITRALAVPESALAGYTATTFKDTAGYGWAVPYLAFCNSKGIMLGDGNGNAMPGRTINVNEAMTMMLRAVGYTSNSAELVGTWPSNYVTLAQNAGLYDDVANVVNVDKANAAQIIYNALTVQKVAVNSDGETKYLEKSEDVEANLLNTGLGCDTDENETITNADYDNATMNITNMIGAVGTKYVKDGDLVAFTPDSTALTGYVNSDNKFVAGDTKYTFGTNAAATATAILNTESDVTDVTSVAKIDTYADAADFGEVTLNVDLSGKTINEVYTVVAWVADEAAVVDADDLEKIDDASLLTLDFDTDDDDAIIANQFVVSGVASLDKIAPDNVVYVYADNEVIRKVAVGTETVKGTISEMTDESVYISGTEYEFAADQLGNDLADVAVSDLALDDEVTLSLDVEGYVFSADVVSSTPNTYGILKAFDTGSDLDSARVKIYTSDDANKTFVVDDEATSAGGVYTTPNMIGYALNAAGDIDAFDVAEADSIAVKSTKVLRVADTTDYAIDANAVVFTFSGASPYASNNTFDVSALANIDILVAKTATDGAYILNDDNKVVAFLIPDEYVDGTDDAVYAVINTITSVKDGDDTVQKLVGFEDGTAYTVTTASNPLFNASTYNNAPQLFKLTPDTAGKVKTTEAATEIVVSGTTIASISKDNTVFTMDDGGKYTVDADAVVYKATLSGGNYTYTASSLADIDTDKNIVFYDTKDDVDGIATVVIWY